MRTSGILLPIFSLPGEYGIGGFSKEAYEFVDFLEKAGQSYWQILPVGPTSYGDSPYQSFSTFAGNPYFISLDTLVKERLLTKEECRKARLTGDRKVNYGLQYRRRYPLLRKAYERFLEKGLSDSKEYKAFVKANAYWLTDYTLFMAIKDANGGVSFQQWPRELRMREAKVLKEFSKSHEKEIGFYKFLQFKFYEQWNALKEYANKKGIGIIGDIPIYVAEDSSDVWANPELFQLNKNRKPTRIAGCPPDGFSEDGQRWGNPLYNWPYHKKTGYAWWILRIKQCVRLYDVVRIDHFRGFDEFYSIPASEETARNGAWKKGPGMSLFKAVKAEIPELNIIAEDLGYITDSVRKLVKDTGFPNMKVLEFAFDGRDLKDGPASLNDYLPFRYEHNCVVYTGTHDNETLVGWLSNISDAEKKEAAAYVGLKNPSDKQLAKALLRQAVASVADYCVIPMQDYLGLDNKARINMPSTLGENWQWRMDQKALTKDLAKEIRELTSIYGRLPVKPEKAKGKSTGKKS